jgi:hypothetical protein
MITGHSNGHPRTKKMAMMRASFHQSPRGSARSDSVIKFAEPSLVKTAPNTLDATARNSTIATVTIVPMAALVADLKSSRP